ncbi:hypothetical protein ES705_17048 [subsurface metagenome]
MKEHTVKTLALIEKLRKLREDLPSLGSEIAHTGNMSMYPMDMVIIGIVKRCLSTTSALEKLIIEWNMICSRAVLRMQLDTVLRLSAFWLSPDLQKMAVDVMSGKQVNKMSDRDNNKMTDSYLSRKLGEQFDWVPRVYKYTSGYIHFSEKHLFDSICKINDKEKTVDFVINDKDCNFPEFSWVELVSCATECSQIIKYFLDKYRQLKDLAVNKSMKE